MQHLASLLSGSGCLGRHPDPDIATFLETALPDLQALPDTSEAQRMMANFNTVIGAQRGKR